MLSADSKSDQLGSNPAFPLSWQNIHNLHNLSEFLNIQNASDKSTYLMEYLGELGK